MKTRIILPVTNDLSTDQRMHRIATTLTGAGGEVLLLGRQLPESVPMESRPYRTHRMRLWFRKGKLFYAEYTLRLFFFLLSAPAHIVCANDLDTLAACYLAARFRGFRLLYDSHEYFTEVPELIGRPLTRKVWLAIERWIFPRLSTVYTVNEAIAGIYSRKYGVAVQVIRNLPARIPEVPQHQRSKTLLYQGSLNVGRGIELMIAAMHLLPDYQLWIAGGGDVEEALRTQALPLGGQVVFTGKIAPSLLPAYTSQACLGMSLEEDLGENYRYASPNKVYDYIQSHTPVLVSDLPVMRGLVEQWKVGDILPARERTPAGLAARIRALCEDPERYTALQVACREAAATLCWEHEQQKLLTLYQLAAPSAIDSNGSLS